MSGRLPMYYFLVNPSSCSGRGLKIWQELEAYLKDSDIKYTACFSKRQGHVEELMHDITSEHAGDETPINVIVLGGDGTLDEALQGITDFEKVNVGYIPTGSSNDFARALKYPDSPLKALKRILECEKPLLYDLGRLKYEKMSEEKSRVIKGNVTSSRYFDVSCGIGFDAAICEEALAAGSKNFLNKIGLGKLTYLAICLKQLFGSKLSSGTLILDGEETVKFNKLRFIVGMNTCFEGGGFKFAPAAVPDDGYLDICAVGDIGPFGVLVSLPSAMKGKHVKNKKIHIYHVKSYEVITEEPLWVHTDGEVYTKATHIKVSVMPQKLRFLT